MAKSPDRPRLRRCVALVALLALLGMGCTQLIGGKAEIRQNRLYLIEAKTIRSFLEGSERPYPLVVEIETFSVARAYNRNEIIFRRNELEIQLDKGHTWAVRPADMITDAVGQYLERLKFVLVGRTRFHRTGSGFHLEWHGENHRTL